MPDYCFGVLCTYTIHTIRYEAEGYEDGVDQLGGGVGVGGAGGENNGHGAQSVFHLF